MAFHSLAIGASALMTARYGIDVTGQNLGNIDTPGYSRQRLTQSATPGWQAGLNNAVLGTGVYAKSVARIANEYVEKQLRQATSTDSYYSNLRNCYSNIQSFFNELTDNALSDAMNKFWNSLEDVSNHVETIPVRTTFLKDAEGMIKRFNAFGKQLKDYRSDVNDQVGESVNQINCYLQQIAALNKAIVNTELGGATGVMANDLRDQRGEAIKSLYELMDIDVVEESNGASIISIHGRNLVYYDQVNEIQMQQTLSDDMMVYTPTFSQDGYPVQPRDGQLAAQIEMRDEIIKSYKDDLDSLAGSFIWEFNKAYSQTRGLEPFSSVTSLNAPLNPADTLDKLQYNDLIPNGLFQIVNGNFEIVVHNKNTNQDTTVNIEVDLDGRPGPNGEPDMILWDPDNPEASNSLINRMQQALDDKVPGVFKVSIDRNYNITIETKSTDYGFAFGKDSSGVVAALGLNVLFTGHNALSMGVNQDLYANPQYVGGAYNFTQGNNEGALALLKLRDAKVCGSTSKAMTIDEYYQSITGRLGSEARKTKNLQEMQADIRQRMYVQRESLSGVNEDEETTKLITYQRAFQGAAKFISTVDIMYETLINM